MQRPITRRLPSLPHLRNKRRVESAACYVHHVLVFQRFHVHGRRSVVAKGPTKLPNVGAPKCQDVDAAALQGAEAGRARRRARVALPCEAQRDGQLCM